MSDFLNLMASRSRQRVDIARSAIPISELRALETDSPKPLQFQSFDLIAEVKRTSPSAGVLEQNGLDIITQARHYADAGAALISVLTEPSRFGGSGKDLRSIAGELDVPVMRKDFLVDPYQIVEARCWGASAVLLIARILDDSQLCAMLDASAEMGLSVLLEAFDSSDLDRSSRAVEGRDKVMLGLNCRDLASLHEDTDRFEALITHFPGGSIKIAESGIASAEDAARVSRLGYDGVLVGTALMRSDDPHELARRMITAGRNARA